MELTGAMSRVEGIYIAILSTVKPSPLKSEDQAASWGLSESVYCAALAGLGFIGAAVLTIATRWGIGLYADSIVYIGVARNILDGKGVTFLNDVGEITPVTQYPPFYSVTIALAGLVGLDPLEGARWISILFYIGNALLLAYIAYSSTSSYGAALLASFLALSAFPMVSIHSQALSEPMFIFLVLLGFSFLVDYLHRSKPWMLHGCALIIGASCLVRYVGIALIMTVILAILCLSDAGWRKRITDATMFSIESSVPLAAWLVRNYWLAGTATNRTFGFHPPTLRDLLPGIDTVAHWLIPAAIIDAAPWWSRSLIAIVFLGLLWLARKVDLSRSKFPHLLVFCILGYGMFLLVSLSLNDQPLYLDTRTLALPYVAVMILAVVVMTDWRRASNLMGKSWKRFNFDCWLIIILAVQMVNGAAWLRHSYFNGIGFAMEWRISELLKFVKDAPVPLVVFSNAPDFIYTLTGKPAFMIPRKVDPTRRVVNSRYAAETTAMHDELKRRNAVLVYFNGEGRLWYLPSIEELEAQLPLQVVKAAADGAVYNLKGTKLP